MTKLLKVYTCAACGSTLGVLREGTGKPVCCGRPMHFSQAGPRALAEAWGWTPRPTGSANTGEAIIGVVVAMALGQDLVLRVSGAVPIGFEGLGAPAATAARVLFSGFLCWFLCGGSEWARRIVVGLFGAIAVWAAVSAYELPLYHSVARGVFTFALVGLYASSVLLLYSRHVEGFLAAQAGRGGRPDASGGREGKARRRGR